MSKKKKQKKQKKQQQEQKETVVVKPTPELRDRWNAALEALIEEAGDGLTLFPNQLLVFVFDVVAETAGATGHAGEHHRSMDLMAAMMTAMVHRGVVKQEQLEELAACYGLLTFSQDVPEGQGGLQIIDRRQPMGGDVN